MLSLTTSWHSTPGYPASSFQPATDRADAAARRLKRGRNRSLPTEGRTFSALFRVRPIRTIGDDLRHAVANLQVFPRPDRTSAAVHQSHARCSTLASPSTHRQALRSAFHRRERRRGCLRGRLSRRGACRHRAARRCSGAQRSGRSRFLIRGEVVRTGAWMGRRFSHTTGCRMLSAGDE